MSTYRGVFNQEKALVGAFSVIVKTGCGADGSFYSTIHFIQSQHLPSPALGLETAAAIAGNIWSSEAGS